MKEDEEEEDGEEGSGVEGTSSIVKCSGDPCDSKSASPIVIIDGSSKSSPLINTWELFFVVFEVEYKDDEEKSSCTS